MVVRPFTAVAATDADVARILAEKKELWAFVKIDGLRCLNPGWYHEAEHRMEGRLRSRSMKKFPNLELNSIFERPEYVGCDGELVVTEPNDPMACRAASAAAATIRGSFDWRWYVFDNTLRPDAPYRERYASIPMFEPIEGGIIRKLPATPIRTMAEFHAFERKAVEKNGFEGIILRDPNARYKENKSTLNEGWMLKVKRFADAEAEIIGFEEEMGNANAATLDERGLTKRSNAKAGMVPKGRLGAFICRDLESKIEFSVGGGFTSDERMLFWASRETLLGKIITYKHLPSGVKEKPRHSGFKMFREAFDMDPVRAKIALPADVADLV